MLHQALIFILVNMYCDEVLVNVIVRRSFIGGGGWEVFHQRGAYWLRSRLLGMLSNAYGIIEMSYHSPPSPPQNKRGFYTDY